MHCKWKRVSHFCANYGNYHFNSLGSTTCIELDAEQQTDDILTRR